VLGIWLGKLIAWRRRGWLEFAATLGGTAFYTSFPPWLAFVVVNIIAFSLGWLPPEKLIDPLKWLDVSVTLNQAIMRLLFTMAAAGIAYGLVEWLSNKYAWYRSWIRAVGVGIILVMASVPWIVSGLAPQAIDLLYHLALPFITLVLLSFGETMLVMRTTMVEAMEADHVPVAIARGLPENTVRDRHVARIAILPVLARFIVHLPLVIIGSFVIERVFFWDGMGQVLIDAVQDNDLPILLGVLSLAAIGILVAHVILDVITVWLDPRLRRIAAPS
jgi:peptide/nickel transport system permease protein